MNTSMNVPIHGPSDVTFTINRASGYTSSRGGDLLPQRFCVFPVVRVVHENGGAHSSNGAESDSVNFVYTQHPTVSPDARLACGDDPIQLYRLRLYREAHHLLDLRMLQLYREWRSPPNFFTILYYHWRTVPMNNPHRIEVDTIVYNTLMAEDLSVDPTTLAQMTGGSVDSTQAINRSSGVGIVFGFGDGKLRDSGDHSPMLGTSVPSPLSSPMPSPMLNTAPGLEKLPLPFNPPLNLYESRISSFEDAYCHLTDVNTFVLWNPFRTASMIAAVQWMMSMNISVHFLTARIPSGDPYGKFVDYMLVHVKGLHHSFTPLSEDDYTVILMPSSNPSTGEPSTVFSSVFYRLQSFYRTFRYRLFETENRYHRFLDCLQHCLWDINGNNFRYNAELQLPLPPAV